MEIYMPMKDTKRISIYAKVKIGNNQEMAHSERNSHSKIRGWQKLN